MDLETVDQIIDKHNCEASSLIQILLDIQGVPEAILKAERNYAHTIIEEFMIAANEAVAEHLERLNIPALYRVHEEPDPHKLEEISNEITYI